LSVAFAIFFSSCEAVNGPGEFANGDLSASRSSAKVGQTIITTDTQLADIGNGLPANGDYQLGDDLTLTNWTPICGPASKQGVPFTGTFNGAGYTITVNSFDSGVATTVGNYGIFAEIVGNNTVYPEIHPVISNLTVEIATGGPFKADSENLGGLVGHAYYTAFDTITVTGLFDIDLIDTDQNLGGVAGNVEKGQFNNTTVTAGFDIRFHGVSEPATVNVGGVAGSAQTSQFTASTISPASFGVTSTNPDATVVNTGGIAGLAVSSTFSNANISGTFNGTLNNSVPIKWERVWIEDTPRFRSSVADPGSDGLNVGGVAGHADSSQFNTIVSSATLNANSGSAPVYVGGVVGYAKGATINTSQISGSVDGSGYGYNSSAGGVAGYIVASRVRDSYADGNVTLKGPSDVFGWGASWQIYAGGLVGYVGGSDDAPSLVDHSHATGDVYAYSPFPYAGGLVGYLYGFNDFSNPAKNGSTVKRSYATGDVTAESQPDTTAANNGDIPYAGGLVGYSSVVDSTIVDSYATGDAYATTEGTFAWAGGIVGGNANDAVVLRTYATGDVESETGDLSSLYPPQYADPGPAAGGIAGFNYYTENTSVSNSVALNGTVYGNQSTAQNVVHRVAGSLGDGTGHNGTLDDNLAYEDMVVEEYWKIDPGANRKDGANVAAVPPQSDFTALGWDFAKVWAMGTGGYPILR
jgi:hypothetical protein